MDVVNISEEDIIEQLDINLQNIMYEVRRELKTDDANISDKYEELRNIINRTAKIEWEESNSENTPTKGACIRRKGKVGYYSIKNIRFHLLDFIQAIFDLLSAVKFPFVASTIFLVKIIQIVGVELEENEAAVCIALYEETRQRTVTDLNLTKVIGERLKEGDYEISISEIYDEIDKLLELGIIEIEQGKYEITQKIYI